MSFGWSASDLAAAVQLLVNVAAALRDIDGARARYQRDNAYLLSLANVLQRVENTGTGLGRTTQGADVLINSIFRFQQRIQTIFEEPLGKNARGDWLSKLKSSPRKIQYGLLVCKEVDELRRQIDIPLRSITIKLGIENYELSRQIRQTGLETRSLVDDLNTSLSDLSVDITKAVKVSQQDQLEQLDRQFTEITNWLKPFPFADIYRQLLCTLAPGSCEWLLERNQFLTWTTADKVNGRYPILWITSLAGAGKTRLATKAIQKLRSSQRLAYFYCDAQDETRQNVISILRNWSWQLLQQDQSHLGKVAAIRAKQQLATHKVSEEILQSILQDTEGTILVLDAFDECEAQEQAKLYPLLSRISNLYRETFCNGWYAPRDPYRCERLAPQ